MERIKRARKLIYVVTNDSLKSVWCSWELGFADCDKGVNEVALLTIKPNNGRWKYNEYLQQYSWIEYSIEDDIFLIHLPNGKILTLFEWLTSR